MKYKLLDGKVLANKILIEVRKKIEVFKKHKKKLVLASIVVGNNPAAGIYIAQQEKSCRNAGINYKLIKLHSNITREKLIKIISQLNKNKSITGIILQLPLPVHIAAREVQETISLQKDIEGVNPYHRGMLFNTSKTLISPTALAAFELFNTIGMDLKGKEVVIAGHSEIVGKPLALLLLQSAAKSPTVTICHIATRNLAFHTKRADILFTAVGKPNLISANMVKNGAVVIDIGISRFKNKIAGDVDFEKVKKKCSYITPVPGGVGPVTVAMLLNNVVKCAGI